MHSPVADEDEYATVVKVNAKKIKDRYSIYITIPKLVWVEEEAC